MLLYHVTNWTLIQKYLKSKKILAPVRAWKSLSGAERFARQTERPMIIILKGNGQFKPLGGHQDQALVSDNDYFFSEESLK